MSPFAQELRCRLDAIREQGLYRQLRCIGSAQGPRLQVDDSLLLSFCSNDYLGLANDPRLRQAAIKAVERYGTGSGAARLVCGSLAAHHELEDALAAFKGTEAALTFSSGYATAVGTITALLDHNDVVVIDKLAHACIVDAARLCGAKLRVFAHNDLNDLERILQWADRRATPATRRNRPHTLVVTESVFSMDGDAAPLRDLVELKDRFGAWLMLDEAHATGLFGPRRRGLAEESGLSDRVEIHMGTLGKALGSAGGFICGSRSLIDYLVNRARSFIFSTAAVPAAAAAATAAVRFVQSEAGEDRRSLFWQRQGELAKVITAGRAGQSVPRGPIIPLRIGAETEALRIAADLRALGLYIPAIRYPTVARGAARLRLTITAAHAEEDLRRLADALARLDLSRSALRHA